MKILKSILFGIKLFVSLVSFILRGKNFKISLASAILLNFIKTVRNPVNFLTTPRQQMKIIPVFAQMSRLINDSLESGKVTQGILTKIIQNNNQETSCDIKQIADSFSVIKLIAPQSHNFNKFLENVEKSWKANDARNIKPNNNIETSKDKTLQVTQESGGYFFLALTYLLNPNVLSEEIKNAIYISGAWFQFLDDYRDRKEDTGHKNTLFTEHGISSKELLQSYITESKSQIQKAIGEQNDLLAYMEILTSLVLLFDFTNGILDWK